MKEIKTSTLEWQLGYYVGEYIVHNFLPDLSIDCYGEHGKRTIIVSEEETEEYKRLNKAWNDATDAPGAARDKWGKVDYKVVGVKEWSDYIAYRTMLKYKYLPPFLECYVPQIHIDTDKKEEFIKGIECALWNSDMSYYWCPPDTQIENDEHFWLTRILLPLHHDGENKK
jgi:hypothetical protein